MPIERQVPVAHSAALWLISLSLLVAGVSANEAEVEAEPRLIPVTTAKVADLVFFPEHTAPATVVSMNNARVSAEIGGLLRELGVKVGDLVEAGATVARIDCREPEIALAQAVAAHQASQAKSRYDESQLATARKLSASNSISSEELDRRRSNAQVSAAEVDKAEADVDKARLAVERCEIKAPFNAVVVERMASIGDFLSPGSPVVQLIDTDSIEVSARIQEIDLESIRGAAEYLFDSQDRSYPVRLRAILPVMDSRLRSYETRFEFIAKRTSPGSAGRLRWRSQRPHLPAELLVQRDGLGVYVMREGRAVFVPIAGSQAGRPALIDLDLAEDVVLDGRFMLKEGDPLLVPAP